MVPRVERPSVVVPIEPGGGGRGPTPPVKFLGFLFVSLSLPHLHGGLDGGLHGGLDGVLMRVRARAGTVPCPRGRRRDLCRKKNRASLSRFLSALCCNVSSI